MLMLRMDAVFFFVMIAAKVRVSLNADIYFYGYSSVIEMFFSSL